MQSDQLNIICIEVISLCTCLLSVQDKVYTKNRMGPRKEPWGTPQTSNSDEDSYQEENNFRADPETTTHCLNHNMVLEKKI